MPQRIAHRGKVHGIFPAFTVDRIERAGSVFSPTFTQVSVPAPTTYVFPTTLYRFPIFPDDGGVPSATGMVNVRDYGATGNGSTDDTAAFLSAINSNMTFDNIAPSKPIFVPDGTYILSDRLVRHSGTEYRSEFYIQGESEAGTILKLAAGASGYGNAAIPKAVIYQSSETVSGGTNTGYRNYVQDLTINLNGNAGAIGIDTQSHNTGALRRITVIATGAYCGIRAERDYPGPSLFHRIHVIGGQYGVRCVNFLYQEIMEHLWVEGQTVYGVLIDSLPTVIRGMKSSNTVPAIHVQGSNQGGLTLVDAVLSGGGGAVSAIRNAGSGKVFVRNVQTTGYRAAVDEGATPATGVNVVEYATAPKHSLWTVPQFSLNLTIKNTPDTPYPTIGNWTNVTDYGVVPGAGNRSAALQAAIDSGATHLYFPPVSNNRYYFGDQVTIRGNVEHILFLGASVSLNSTITGKTFLRIENTTSSRLTIEHFWLWSSGYSASKLVENASNKDLILKDFFGPLKYYTAAPVSGSLGALYIDDAIVGEMNLAHNQDVWSRQHNAEAGTMTKTAGGDVWVLGLKSEGAFTMVNATAGRYELLGAFNHINQTLSSTMPCYQFANISASIAGRTSYATNNPSLNDWTIVVKETLSGVTRTLLRDVCDVSDGGRWVNLYRSGV